MPYDKNKFPHTSPNNPKLHYSEMRVLRSAAGYYLGRTCWEEQGDPMMEMEEPYSRESDYFAKKKDAEEALKGEFALRQCIENEAGYESGALPKPNIVRKSEDN